MHILTDWIRARAAAGAVIAVLACAAVVPTARAGVMIYALTEGDGLLSFDSDNPSRIIESVPKIRFSGLSDANMLGIDFRGTNQLYAIGSGGFDASAELLIGPLASSGPTFGQGFGFTAFGDPADTSDPFGRPTGLRGTRFGMSINATADRVSIVSNNRQNLTGVGAFLNVITTHPELAYAPGDTFSGRSPNVVDLAHLGDNLFGIDTGTDALVTVDQATGLLRTVGLLQTDVSAVGGFDAVFAPGGYEAFAALQPTGSGISFLYRIDLTTGLATNVGQIDGGELLDGLAIVPEPGAIAALTCAAPLLLARWRRHRN